MSHFRNENAFEQAGFSNGFRPDREGAVFDRGRSTIVTAAQRGASTSLGNGGVNFRRTAADNCRGVDVTRQILGDPIPGRSAQDKLDRQK